MLSRSCIFLWEKNWFSVIVKIKPILTIILILLIQQLINAIIHGLFYVRSIHGWWVGG